MKNVTFTEDLSFSIVEGSINEEKHTVRVCALASCVSKNNRYYSPNVVETAAGTLAGKKSYADHDERNTKNLVGRIVDEKYENGRLYADIKLSKAKGVARETWDKINDGTITDVSIAADGKTKMVKLGNKRVSEVTELDIKSVDFVPEGGVAAAKVQQVFENIKDIPTVTEVKEEMIESLEQLKTEYPDFVAKLKDENKVETDKLADGLKKANEAKEAAEFKLVEKEMAEFKKDTISKQDVSDKVKGLLEGRVTGKTKDEITKSLGEALKEAKAWEEAYKANAKTKDVPGSEKKKVDIPKPWTQGRIREDANIPEELKVEACERLVLDGSEAMIKWLTQYDIKL